MASHETLPVTESTTLGGSTPAGKRKKLSQADFDAWISDPRFNRTFRLPADPAGVDRNKEMNVSYADFGYHRDADTVEDAVEDEEDVLLFFGPLMSSQFLNAAKDGMAKRHKVRVIHVARPGIGKSDAVPAEKRLEDCRETTAALLKFLNVKHVAIGCHSAGTLFGLDFAIHYPHYLHPSRPYIAFAGPWVHPSHSGMFIWSMASHLPSSLVAKTGSMVAFVNSSSLLQSLGAASTTLSGSMLSMWTAERAKGREGPDVEFEEGVLEQLGAHIFTENVGGVGPECQVLLRNGVEEKGWSDWGDFDVLAARLADSVHNLTGARLKVDVFFTEKDNMIGDASSKGCEWFEACWKNLAHVDFTSQVLVGADHDTAWALRWGVLETVCTTIRQRS